MSGKEPLKPEEIGAGEPTFEQTLMNAAHDLWKNRLWVGLYLVVLVGGVLVNAFFQVPYYRATTEILVNAASLQNVGEREMLKNLSLQEVVISSPKIAEVVIEELELKKLPLFDASEDATLTFLSLLSVKANVKSSTLKIQYDFPEPQKVAAIANKIAEVYVRFTSARSAGTTQGSLEVLKQQLETERAKKNEIRAKIDEITAQYPALTNAGNLQERLKFFNNELLKTESRLIEMRTTLDQLDDFQKRGESLEMHPFIRSRPNIASKLERIRELELLLVELEQEYRGKHPEVSKANAKLAALRDVLTGEELGAVEELRGELLSLERTRDQMRKRIEQLQGDMYQTTPEKIKHMNYLAEAALTDEAILSLNKKVSALMLEGSLKQSRSEIEIMKYATVPNAPYKPDVPKNLFLAIVFGLFSSLGVFFIKHYFNRTISKTEDVYRYLRRPLVGQAVLLKGNKGFFELGSTDDEAKKRFLEKFDLMSANSDFLVGKEKNYSILITSSFENEGKTFVACQLALAFTAKGKKTVLIDADFCRGQLTEQFSETGIKPQKFLDQYLASDIDEKGLIIPTFNPLLDFIGAGLQKSSMPHTFRSTRLKELIAKLQAIYDIVLFDTPPVLPVNDAVALSPLMNLRLFVIDAGKTLQKDIFRALVKIDPSHQVLIGVILNRMPRVDEGYEYYEDRRKT